MRRDLLILFLILVGATVYYYFYSQGGGTYNGRFLYGTWESSSLGIYHAYFSTKITPCIVLSDAEKTVVFNSSNAEATESLYEELFKYWKDQ